MNNDAEKWVMAGDAVVAAASADVLWAVDG